MATCTLTAFGGLSLGFEKPISTDFSAMDMNARRLEILGQRIPDGRIDIVSDEESVKAAYREFSPYPPGRFKYGIAELLDHSFQIRFSGSTDSIGCNWNCEHPQLFLTHDTLSQLPDNQSHLFSERLVAAGFAFIKGTRVYIDGSSGNYPTVKYSTAFPSKIHRSPFAGLATATNLFQMVFPPERYSLKIIDGNTWSASEYLAHE